MIGYQGVVAIVTAPKDSRQYRRAEMMIELFKLNDRSDLRDDRIDEITFLYLALIHGNVTAEVDPNQHVRQHANCGRSYLRLWNSNNDMASKIGQICFDMSYKSLQNRPLLDLLGA